MRRVLEKSLGLGWQVEEVDSAEKGLEILVEKREKFDITLNDQIVGFEIFGAQKKLDEYKDIYAEVIRDGSDYALNLYLCEEVARTMLYFKADEHQRDVLEMSDTLKEKIFD